MIVKINRAVKRRIFRYLDFIMSISFGKKPNSLLIIRLDAIGDYILFRNFIALLKNSNEYKTYKITLLGNSIWRDLAIELDSNYIDEFIWLDTAKFNKHLIYRYLMLRKITFMGYKILLSPAYSREFYIDNIVKLISADEKIGSVGNLSNITPKNKNIGDKHYTKLIPAKKELLFEFYRNKEFFENLLKTKLKIRKPQISLQTKTLDFVLPKQYVVLFIGASNNFRKWDTRNFAEVAQYLYKYFHLEIVLCGGPGDKNDANNFSKYFHNNYLDLVGKTSLIDLLYVIDSCDLMVSNETSAPHFAAALSTSKILVLYNGNHYGRFTPYPKEISKDYYVIYHPSIEKDLGAYKQVSNSKGFKSELNIQDITTQKVIETVTNVLK